jgi:hypothetical protein
MKPLKTIRTAVLAILVFVLTYAVFVGYAVKLGFRFEKDLWVNGVIFPIAIFASYFAGLMLNGFNDGKKLSEVFENNRVLITGSVLAATVLMCFAANYAMADSPPWANAIIVLLFFILTNQNRKK